MAVAGSAKLKEELPRRLLLVLEALGVTVSALMAKGMTREQLLDPEFQRGIEAEMWRRGDLSYLLKPSAQTDVYRFTMDWKAEHPQECGPLLWNVRRGGGKSHLGLNLCVSRCLKDPNHMARFVSPTTKQTGEIIEQPLKTILDDCPKDLYPEKRYDKYYFRNPAWEDPKAVSVLHLCGCKEQAGALRGPRSDTIFVDEAREIDDLQYIIEGVLTPHFITREAHEPLLIISSTPPDYGTHPFWTVFVDPAERDGRYIRRNVEEDDDFTEADRKMLIGVCHDEKSTAWKREALCRRVSAEERMVIPEFGSSEDGDEIRVITLVDSWPRPKHYFPHMGADFGLMDNSAMLWGYVHWPEDEQQQLLLVVEDEYVTHYRSTGELAEALKAKEETLYADAPHKDSLGRPIVRRYADNDALALMSFRVDHGIQISAADKWDLESSIAELRTKFREGRIRILKRCTKLINQLENGLLDKKGRIERSEDQAIGHCDAIMALAYLNRMINWRLCPIPLRQVSGHNLWVNRQPIDVRRAPVSVTREPLYIMNQPVVQ